MDPKFELDEKHSFSSGFNFSVVLHYCYIVGSAILKKTEARGRSGSSPHILGHLLHLGTKAFPNQRRDIISHAQNTSAQRHQEMNHLNWLL